MNKALFWLRKARCSPFDLVLMVLDEDRQEFHQSRSRFYMEAIVASS